MCLLWLNSDKQRVAVRYGLQENKRGLQEFDDSSDDLSDEEPSRVKRRPNPVSDCLWSSSSASPSSSRTMVASSSSSSPRLSAHLDFAAFADLIAKAKPSSSPAVDGAKDGGDDDGASCAADFFPFREVISSMKFEDRFFAKPAPVKRKTSSGNGVRSPPTPGKQFSTSFIKNAF
jgi:hypothetical protein